MKYYYNGELVRTSKNENYKFYCPLTKTCSTTRNGALATARAYKNSALSNLKYFEDVLRKLEKGIKVKYCVTGENFTIEQVRKHIESYNLTVIKYSNVEVVELEARA